MQKLVINTHKKREILDITDKVGAVLGNGKAETGICNLLVLHTTAARAVRGALLELDSAKLNQRVEAARQAVHQRLSAKDESLTKQEREKLDDALRVLYVLTRGSDSA